MEQVSAISIQYNNDLNPISWRVDYNDGESGEVAPDVTIQLSDCAGLQVGQECWPLLVTLVGANHQCGDNVAYDPNGGTAVYEITGDPVSGLSCSLQ